MIVNLDQMKILKIKISHKWEIEYLTQTLKEAELKLESLGDVGYISLTDDSFIDVYRKKLSEVASEEEALYNKREQILEEVRIYETEKRSYFILYQG